MNWIGLSIQKTTSYTFNTMPIKQIFKWGGIVVVAVGSAVASWLLGKEKGKEEGYKKGTIDQAHRDAKKMKEMKDAHDRDRREWSDILNER